MRKILFAIVLASCVLAIYPGYNFWTITEVVVTIDQKQRDSNLDAYTVSTICESGCSRNVEEFLNQDAWLFFKTKSSDLQTELTKNGKFRLRVNGFRNSWFSMRRNIIDIVEVIHRPGQIGEKPCD